MDKKEINKIISGVCRSYWNKGLRYGVRNNDNWEKVYIHIKAPRAYQTSYYYHELVGLSEKEIKEILHEFLILYFQIKCGDK